MRIGVIDDNELRRTRIAQELETLGASVHTAAAGTCGCDLILDELPDIALVDLATSDLDGLELARRIRAFGARRVHMVAITSDLGPDHDRELRDAGFDESLRRPVRREVLRALLERVVIAA